MGGSLRGRRPAVMALTRQLLLAALRPWTGAAGSGGSVLLQPLFRR